MSYQKCRHRTVTHFLSVTHPPQTPWGQKSSRTFLELKLRHYLAHLSQVRMGMLAFHFSPIGIEVWLPPAHMTSYPRWTIKPYSGYRVLAWLSFLRRCVVCQSHFFSLQGRLAHCWNKMFRGRIKGPSQRQVALMIQDDKSLAGVNGFLPCPHRPDCECSLGTTLCQTSFKNWFDWKLTLGHMESER